METKTVADLLSGMLTHIVVEPFSTEDCKSNHCDQKMDYCTEQLYTVTTDDRDARFYGPIAWVCGLHLQTGIVKVLGKLDDQRQDEEYNVWEAEMERKAVETAFRKCPICFGEGEHDWEVHNAEMRASSYEN